MTEMYVIFQNETDGATYSESTFIRAFESQSVAESVVEELTKQVGYITSFGEERTFSVQKKLIQPDKDLKSKNTIIDQLKKEFAW